MDEHGPDGAFLSTLTTEHFVSQSVSGRYRAMDVADRAGWRDR
jgi:hypothetical protein